MKATDLIDRLRSIVAERGDCEVTMLECSSFELTALDAECVAYDDEAKTVVLGSSDPSRVPGIVRIKRIPTR